MANLLGQIFFSFIMANFCKGKSEAGPGFHFFTFADRVREISWGRNFKRLDFFFPWQSRDKDFKKLLGTRRAIQEVIGQYFFSILLRSHPRILRSGDHSSSRLLRSHLACTVCDEVGCAIWATHFTAKSRAHNDFTAIQQNCCDLTCAFCAAYFTANSLGLAFFNAQKNRKSSHSNTSLDFFYL